MPSPRPTVPLKRGTSAAVVYVRLTSDESALLTRWCDALSLSRVDLIRRAIRHLPHDVPLTPSTARPALVDAQTVASLRQVAGYLHVIMTGARGRDLTAEEHADLLEIRSAFKSIAADLRSRLA